MPPHSELWLIRHGETEWSLSGAHTGRTDIPLTPRGEQQARSLGALLAGHAFSLVLTSPLRRASDTCRLAGYGEIARVDPDLCEWDYGAYEGRTTAAIREERPGWSVWEMGVPQGESVEQVGARAKRVIQAARDHGGRVAVFGHGHHLRILTACWLGLAPAAGRLFVLGTAALSVLGQERETPALISWNLTRP